jgi:sn-glycerol 3-phosphate transport system ATP-binding protein
MVAAVEYLGADSLVTCRLGNATLAARVGGSVGLGPGDTAWLSWRASAQHFFERDGRRRADDERSEAATMFA